MRNVIYILIIMISVSCLDSSSPCSKYLEKKYLRANLEHEQFYKDGDIHEAIKMVEDVILKNHDNYIAIGYLGAYKYSLCSDSRECNVKELKEVYDLYKESLAICDEYRIGVFNIIEVLSELSYTEYQNDEEIIKYLEKYNSKYNHKSVLLEKGGRAMFRLGKFDKSLKYLDEAISLDSLNAIAYIFKGKCYTELERWEESMRYLNYGLSLDSISLGYHERGYVNNQMGKIEEAILDYNTAIALYNNRHESYLGLGVIEVKRNNIDLACQYFRKSKSINEDYIMVDSWLSEFCGE